jgi:phosphoserine phosphatase
MGEILNLTDGLDHLRAPLRAFKRAPKLAVFDFDSTLIINEGIDELARTLGMDTFHKIQTITEKAMQGELEFKQAWIQRMNCLKALTPVDIETTLKRIQLRKGAKTLIQYLKNQGSEIAIVSGGFSWLIDPIAKELGVDHVYCHRLFFPISIQNDRIIGAEEKRDWVTGKMHERNLRPSEVWVFGDGANDRLMMRCAGIRVAIQAKPKLKRESNIEINSGDFTVLKRWHENLNRK